ncbi:hypothetical protein OH768_49760 [Streptomyces sp. NBC_01622]|uniref:hypothetical protein n=1 Tax=Streptomyces sp. NBC_01622 TaxID=2975903 RepID=UPI0038678F0B|nr:hypothetical protein OH768_49760 [Streptomyces sp. NBC_01622]
MSALSCLRSHTAVVKSPERIRNFAPGNAVSFAKITLAKKARNKERAKEAHHKHHEKKHHRKHEKHGK